jgi:membrane protease YdiL (CAAX protease family)
MEQRLERRDIRLILVCAVLTLVSLLVGTHFFYDAFPEATIDFRITRDEARVRAASFLKHRGFELAEYRHAGIFEFDNLAKTFLERERGLEGASDIIGKPVRLWRWNNRWFRERHKEEFRVEHTTSGDLVGFSHLVEEEAVGASLTQDSARRLAVQFLAQTMMLDMDHLEFVEAETTQRPHRVDHVFTWKLSDFEVSEGTYRYRVRIQGDLVAGYAEFLKVPESWQRQYDEMRSSNQATGLVAALFLFITWIAMLIRLVAGIRAQDVRWRTALTFGAIAFTLTFLSQLNNLPVTIYGFDTTDTFSSFLTESVLIGLAIALASGIGIAFIVAGAEPEYRRWYGDHVSVSEQFLPDGMRTKRFLMGTIIGLTLTAVFVAYQTLFYLVADHFGAWSPADIPYREMVNTHFPWVVVILIGFMPAVSEEFTSRAFSIPFLHRLLKHRWLAVLLSAAVWGFAHAGYPQQPFWIRGVEVGLAGIVMGYVVIRWGLLPALVWHYTIDALYTAMILLRSSNPYFVLSAAVSVGIMLIPLAVAVFLYARSRYFVEPESLLNREDTPTSIRPQPRDRTDLSPEAQILSPGDAVSVYYPLHPARLGAAALVVLAGLSVFAFSTPDWSPDSDYAVTADAALARARTHLQHAGVAVDSFQSVVSQHMQWNHDEVAYRHERAGPEAAVKLYRHDLASALWRARFYRPQQKEEWQVYLRPADGSLYAIHHQLPEEASGADLIEDEARQLAEDQMRAHGLDPGRFELKESTSEKLPNRRDHRFVWEAAPGDPRNLEESAFRCEVHIAGDRAAGLRRFVKLPEGWLREREEGSTWRTVVRWVLILTIIGAAIHLLWLLIMSIRGGELAWRLPLWIGGAGALLFAVNALNGLPTFFANYPTQLSTGIFILIQTVGLVVGALAIGLFIAGGAGLAESMFPGVLNRLSPAALAPQLKDAVLLAGLAVAGGLAADRWMDVLMVAWPQAAVPAGPAVPDVDSFLPALDGLGRAVSRGLYMPLSAAIVIYYATRVLKRPSFVVAALLSLGACAAGAGAYTPVEFFFEFVEFLLSSAFTAAAMVWLYRDNIAAYALTGFLTVSVDGALRLLEQSEPALSLHGWIWLGVAAFVVVTLWLVAMRAPPNPTDRIVT